ncbi:MAG TPA: HDOD domain-containing protein [Phycisphaerae bacterium]|nr:HDOD domain-containing protein [Phycisphaerae bacterium]HRY70383.1 HDOD domain-containing protein [Phycisphaerae bacterium]HSA28100.1 HDOD domain-containing protein [Phycisphaerae bacterium]
MAFWARISDWWTGRGSDDGPVAIEAGGGTAVAEAESVEVTPIPRVAVASERPAEESSSASCWWRPEGELMVRGPRLDKPVLAGMAGEIEAGVLTALEQALGDPNIELPHLPRIPQQVLMLSRGEATSLREIARLIAQDQVLSADLLRRANSAAYGGLAKVTTVESAVVRLGMRGIRAFMISQSVKHVTLAVGGKAGRSRGESLWRESLASAYVMATVADSINSQSEDAFLAGLLHDIGKVVVLRCCCEVHTKTGQAVPDELFDYLCQEYHELMGEMIAERWQLPPQVGAIIKDHHSEEGLTGEHGTQRALIQMADAVVSLLEYSPRLPYDLFGMPASVFLDLETNTRFQETLVLLPEMLDLAMNSD